MSETATEQTTTAQPPAGTTQAAPKLEDLLADLNEDARKAVLGEVTKARGEAKNLRDRLKSAEPAVKRLAEIEAEQVKSTEQWEAFSKQQQERADKAERDLIKNRVALAKGLELDDLEFIHGDDEESITASADKFLARTGDRNKPRAPRPDPSQGSSAAGGGTASEGDQFAAFLKQQMGR
jgi:hypothetical protein